jgi:hypothetical protein
VLIDGIRGLLRQHITFSYANAVSANGHAMVRKAIRFFSLFRNPEQIL